MNQYELELQTSSFPQNSESWDLADLTGNGTPDLVVTTTWDARIHVFLNDGQGQLSPAWTPWFSATWPVSKVRLIDFNQSGEMDIVVQTIEGYPELRIYFGDGSGMFAENGPMLLELPTWPVAWNLADLNGNGRTDLLLVIEDQVLRVLNVADRILTDRFQSDPVRAR